MHLSNIIMERANNCLLRGAKLCAGILEEVAKATLWSKLSSRRHSGFCCGAGHSGISCRRMIKIYYFVERITPADFIDSLMWIAREWCTRFVYTPSNGPVEEVRGRRGLRQTSWEAQLPIDHADPTDRTIFV
ncbi:hypothetical protein PV328_011735, partial [Microctonus aethiopoides]